MSCQPELPDWQPTMAQNWTLSGSSSVLEKHILESPNPLFQRWGKHESPGGGWNFGAGWPPSNTIQHIPVTHLLYTLHNIEHCPSKAVHVTAWPRKQVLQKKDFTKAFVGKCV